MLRILFLIALIVPAANTRGADRLRPNVVMIVSDDHAWTDYGFMGHPQIQTPNLDKLAGESLCFRRGYVPSSLCCPSLASIITGLYPHQHKVTSNDPPRPEGLKGRSFYESDAFREGRETMNRHIESVATLPRELQKAGYRSLQTGKWWQGDFRRGGFTHGMTTGLRHGDSGLDIGRKTMKPIDDFVKESIEGNSPFFVWYAPMMPHDPHTPPERLLNKYKSQTDSLHVAKYWAMVEWFDETCGELLKILDDRGVADNTMVVYVADNGWIQNPDQPGFLPSKRSPYDAGLRTPILIRWPKRVMPHSSDVPVQSIDLTPTILKACGTTPSEMMPGIDLLDDKAVAARKSVQGACFTHDAVDLDRPAANLMERWMISDGWKVIVPTKLSDLDEPKLYQIETDPREQNDLAKQFPDRVAKLKSDLDGWWKP